MIRINQQRRRTAAPAVKDIAQMARLEGGGGGLCSTGETYKRCTVDRFEKQSLGSDFTLQFSSLSSHFHLSAPRFRISAPRIGTLRLRSARLAHPRDVRPAVGLD